ncbi:MAG: hypothetical protein IKR19_08635 [Acholeplasmatales bacterium]|nr:hypothetical protein [Acholeplasmatales bacterium]
MIEKVSNSSIPEDSFSIEAKVISSMPDYSSKIRLRIYKGNNESLDKYKRRNKYYNRGALKFYRDLFSTKIFLFLHSYRCFILPNIGEFRLYYGCTNEGEISEADYQDMYRASIRHDKNKNFL